MEEKIVITNEQGKEIEYDVLLSFISEKDNKKYIAYTNYEKDEDNNLIINSALYENNKVLPIENEDAIKVIDRMINTLNEASKISTN